MGKGRYSEEESVEKPAGELLRSMGWDLVYAWNEEKPGKYGALGRTSCEEVVLRGRLVDAIAELNGRLEYDRLSAGYPDESILGYRDEIYECFCSWASSIPVEKLRAMTLRFAFAVSQAVQPLGRRVIPGPRSPVGRATNPNLS